jgi:hypothetical protein
VPDKSPIIRNPAARVTLVSGKQVALRRVLLGEQVRLGAGRFAPDVTPMAHDRFRLWQVKGGVRSPTDLIAHNVDRIRRGQPPAPPTEATELAVRPNHPSRQGEWYEVVCLGLPFAGRIESFKGRVVLHGTEEKTGEPRVIALSDIKQLEVTRRKPKPKAKPRRVSRTKKPAAKAAAKR